MANLDIARTGLPAANAVKKIARKLVGVLPSALRGLI